MIPTTPPHRHSALVAALEPKMVASMPRVAATVCIDINVMEIRPDLKFFSWLHAQKLNHTNANHNTIIDESET
jgi:hypothetical protein